MTDPLSSNPVGASGGADAGGKDVERIVLQFDRNELFDMVAKTGDGGEAVGNRLVALLLGDDSFSTAVGLACYGIVRCPDLDDEARGPRP